jgi:hypothetical protein
MTTHPTETASEREKLLAQLTPRELRIVLDVLRNYPTLSTRKAIEMLRFAGL